jgi:hypothetical protein
LFLNWQVAVVHLLSIKFFVVAWILFVLFDKSSRFSVSPYIPQTIDGGILLLRKQLLMLLFNMRGEGLFQE